MDIGALKLQRANQTIKTLDANHQSLGSDGRKHKHVSKCCIRMRCRDMSLTVPCQGMSPVQSVV